MDLELLIFPCIHNRLKAARSFPFHDGIERVTLQGRVMSKNIRKRREKLWNEHLGKCHWCGIATVLPPRGQTRIDHRPDYATLDHLRSRLHSNRQIPNNTNEERTCLSCWQCNNLRGRLDQLSTQEITIDYWFADKTV